MTYNKSALQLQQCSNLTGEISALNADQSNTLLQQLKPAWKINTKEQTISRSYDFKNYYQTIAFVNVVAQIAHQQNHHPDIQLTYKRCTISYSTHSVNGLSIYDFICAAKINAAQNL